LYSFTTQDSKCIRCGASHAEVRFALISQQSSAEAQQQEAYLIDNERHHPAGCYCVRQTCITYARRRPYQICLTATAGCQAAAAAAP
jgi:hypothetical protein